MFFDEVSIREQSAARNNVEFPDAIMQSILSTRGGGVAAFIISEHALETPWFQREMACFNHELVRKHVRLMPIPWFKSVDSVCKHPFVKKFCSEMTKNQFMTISSVPSASEDAVEIFRQSSDDAIARFIDVVVQEIECRVGVDAVVGDSEEISRSKIGALMDTSFASERQLKALMNIRLITKFRHRQKSCTDWLKCMQFLGRRSCVQVSIWSIMLE